MRGFSIYLAAGILIVLAMDFIAPPVGLGIDVFAWPVTEAGAIVQSVDRTNKGDRLPASPAANNSREAKDLKTLPIGCDPAFSPISAGAFKGLASRCVATLTIKPVTPG